MTKLKSLYPIVLLILFSGCHTSDAVKTDDDNVKFCLSDSLIRKISFDSLKQKDVMSELVLSGKITFLEDGVVKIFPLTGGHVEDVRVSLGDYVEKGQVLSIINSSDMADYFNELIAARSNLAIAKKNMDAAEEMYKSGLNSEKEYITAQKEYQKAQSVFNKTNEILKIYGGSENSDLSGSRYIVKAPISGFVVEKNINIGAEIRSDENQSLFTISDLKEVWAVANIYETDISKVKKGDTAFVSTISYPDKIYKGTIDKISNMIDPETKVLTVKIKLTNPDYTLKAGMFAKAIVHYPENRKMLAVSRNCIIFENNKNYVIKYTNKCDLEIHEVVIHKTLGERSYIETDLKKDDVVIKNYSLFVYTALRKI